MHSLSVAIIALMAVVSLPALALANTTEGSELEEPKILPLTDAVKSGDDDKQMKSVNEIWQEDVHEVVIRKQRGAKDNVSGTTTGKKKKNGLSTTTRVPKLHKNSDTNLETNHNTTQEPIGNKKHQHHQSKHDKTNSKKHSSTIKPKPKDESNYQSSIILTSARRGSGGWLINFLSLEQIPAATRKARGASATPSPTPDRELWRWRKAKARACRREPSRRSARKVKARKVMEAFD